MKNTFSIGILALTLIIDLFFLNRLEQNRNTLDHLHEALSPVKKILTNNSIISLIACDTNVTKLHYQTQFVLAPNTVEMDHRIKDTILLLDRSNEEKKDYPLVGYDILHSGSGHGFNVVLMAKKH